MMSGEADLPLANSVVVTGVKAEVARSDSRRELAVTSKVGGCLTEDKTMYSNSTRGQSPLLLIPNWPMPTTSP